MNISELVSRRIQAKSVTTAGMLAAERKCQGEEREVGSLAVVRWVLVPEDKSHAQRREGRDSIKALRTVGDIFALVDGLR